MNFPKKLKDFSQGKGEVLRIYKSGPATQALIAQSLVERGQRVVFVVPGERELLQMRALLALWAGNDADSVWDRDWLFLPSYPPKAPDVSEWAQRWAVLHALSETDRPRGVLLTVDNFLPKWPGREIFEHSVLDLAVGEEILSEMLLEQLVAWGYRRVPVVTTPGEMSMRGDILDVFAPGYSNPVRLEFFGDQLDAARLFTPTTQRSLKDLQEVRLLPVSPALLNESFVEKAREKWRHLKVTGQMAEEARHDFESKTVAGDGCIFPGLYYEKPLNLFEYFRDEAVYLLSGASMLRSKVEEAGWSWQEYFETFRTEKGFHLPEDAVLWPEQDARKAWQDKRQLVFEDLVLGSRKEGLELPERKLESFEDIFWKPDQKKRPWATLVASLRDWENSSFQTVLSFHSARSRSRFLELAEQEGIKTSSQYSLAGRGVFSLLSPLKKGMELEWCQVRILPEDILQPGESRAKKAVDRSFKGLGSYDELKADDLLVHRDYGLALFGGLQRLSLGDVANDYLLLLFDGDDRLYVPVDRMRVVQRYKGPEGSQPALDSMRGSRWKKTKERAKKAIEKIAHELVEMYAYRQVAKGYAYSSPSELYWEFEAGFGFEETPDQDRAIRDVLADMEKAEPMDRLVCGDVGFGKTEVAMRAAFRAVLDGKQVAILCPTTVLAEQHYLNFKSRMQNFPVSVGMLSRFVPRNEQKKITAAAARGQIDILIGTHRLLSKDIDLPRLGLLVLDEEQRFGVKHKERLKELKKDIDCLTLTATPIPRTLQLSLSGIRSLSIIETPPVDRKPVETALIERDAQLLASILKREIERGGQVFWVHNRVRTLDSVEEYVRKLVPDARIGAAHGQMTPSKLEGTIHKFWHGELDVLVCTAIVESGLDFPNANTLIVDQAHMFGLGQLYQLRGRVGRSDKQAYAYFVVPNLDAVPEVARKRLQVILDMDYLGAGFRVAMEDLRLRGAGNILGEAQSGQIAKIGLELFLEMLEEEVGRLKGDKATVARDPEVNFVFPAHIPEGYVPDPDERLRYYKALSLVRTDAEFDDLVEEIRDRFGSLPEALNNFIAVLKLKRILSAAGAEKADLFPNRTVVQWPQETESISPETILAWLQARMEWAKLLPPAKLELRASNGGDIAANLLFFRDELGKLAGMCATSVVSSESDSE